MDEDEARRARFERLQREADEVARGLVGRGVDEATAEVAAHPSLSIRVAPDGGAVTADFRAGRITAWVRDGVIVEAGSG